MTTAENKTLVQRIIETVFNAGDADALADFCPPGSFLAGGLAGQIRSMKAFAPDLHFTIDELVAEGDKVAARLTQRGTNSGPLVGLPALGRLETPLPPTGRSVEVTALYLFTFKQGKLVSLTNEFDQMGMLRQLGWTFTPPSGDPLTAP